MQWTRLEVVLNLVLIRLIRKDPLEGTSHIVFAHMTFPQKMKALNSLLNEIKPPPGSPLSRYKLDVLPLLTSSSKHRNQIAHAVWTVSDDGKVIRTSITAHDKLEMDMHVVPLKEIQAASAEFVAAGKALFNMLVEWAESNPPQRGQ